MPDFIAAVAAALYGNPDFIQDMKERNPELLKQMRSEMRKRRHEHKEEAFTGELTGEKMERAWDSMVIDLKAIRHKYGMLLNAEQHSSSNPPQ